MSLTVVFQGLCLFVHHKNEDGDDTVTVLLPDCSYDAKKHPRKSSDLESHFSPHAAYLSVKAGPEGAAWVLPLKEREIILNGGKLDAQGLEDLHELHEIVEPSDMMRLRSRLLEKDVWTRLRARVRIKGGVIASWPSDPKIEWITQRLTEATADSDHYTPGRCAVGASWTGETIEGVDLDGVLKGGGGKVTIANLPYGNPLNWEQLPLFDPRSSSLDDHHFRWFYELLEPNKGKTRLLRPYPVPRAYPDGSIATLRKAHTPPYGTRVNPICLSATWKV